MEFHLLNMFDCPGTSLSASALQWILWTMPFPGSGNCKLCGRGRRCCFFFRCDVRKTCRITIFWKLNGCEKGWHIKHPTKNDMNIYQICIVYVGAWPLICAAIILFLALVALCFLTFSLAGPAGWWWREIYQYQINFKIAVLFQADIRRLRTLEAWDSLLKLVRSWDPQKKKNTKGSQCPPLKTPPLGTSIPFFASMGHGIFTYMKTIKINHSCR